MTNIIRIAILGLFALAACPLTFGAEIHSKDKQENNLIKTTELEDGHIRYDLCSKSEPDHCQPLGDPRGYTHEQLGVKKWRLRANSIATGAGDVVGGATATAVALAFAGYFVPSVAFAPVTAGAASPFVFSYFDKLNPSLKWHTAKVLSIGQENVRAELDISIYKLAKRLDQALREMPYESTVPTAHDGRNFFGNPSDVNW